MSSPGRRLRRLAAYLLVSALAALLIPGCQQGDPTTTSPGAPLTPSSGGELVVETRSGPVLGTAHDGIVSWRGIPYAAPPVGDLRWRPPQPPQPWQAVRDGTDYGPICPQSSVNIFGNPIPRDVEQIARSSEDCLSVNVNRPRGAAGNLPVVVVVHGGGFTNGSGSVETFNSPTFVQRGVVVVTLNYRLGRLGFFAHPALAAEGRIANFGLLDQMAALSWVRRNIAAFGGDPRNVTIYGGSAGGMSVNALMSSPRAAGLFDKAISQSGLGREPSKTWQEAAAQGERLAAAAGAPDADADELRALPLSAVMAMPLQVFSGDAPIIDAVLPESVADTFAAGEEADVPYLLGTTDAEIPDLVLQRGGVDPQAFRAQLLRGRQGRLVAAYGGRRPFVRHFLSDLVFTEPARNLAQDHARRAPTFLYRFRIAGPSQRAKLGGAPHSEDLSYIFDVPSPEQAKVPDGAELADQISDYWVSFATDGDPNRAGAPTWPSADRGLMQFTVAGPRAVGEDPWQARLDAVRASALALTR